MFLKNSTTRCVISWILILTLALPVLANEVPQLESNKVIAPHAPAPSSSPSPAAQNTPPSKRDYSVAPWAQKALITMDFIRFASRIAIIGAKIWEGTPLNSLDYANILDFALPLFGFGINVFSTISSKYKMIGRIETVMNLDSPQELKKDEVKIDGWFTLFSRFCLHFAVSRNLLKSAQYTVGDYVHTKFISHILYDVSSSLSKTSTQSHLFMKNLMLFIHTLCSSDILFYGAQLIYIVLKLLTKDQIMTATIRQSFNTKITSTTIKYIDVFVILLQSLTSKYIMARLAHVTNNYIEDHKIVTPLLPTHPASSPSSPWKYACQAFLYVPFTFSCMFVINTVIKYRETETLVTAFQRRFKKPAFHIPSDMPLGAAAA